MRSKEEQITRIEELSENLSLSKYNLLKISTLIRLIEESWKNKRTCEICGSNISELDNMIEQITQLENIDVREPYEKKFNQIRKHFHQSHQFIPPGHFVARWSIALLILGSGIASIVSFALVQIVKTDLILGGSAIGLIIGYLIGAYKDGRKRKCQKII